MHLVGGPDVVDVLGEVIRLQFIVLQEWINETFSRMSLNCTEIQKILDLWIQAVLKSLFLSSSLSQRVQPSIDCPLRNITKFSFNLLIRSFSLTAPSSSRGIDVTCRSVLVMNFDTSKQQRSNGCGSMSIHFLSGIGTLTLEFTTDLGFC